jgi:hypothetical protein
MRCGWTPDGSDLAYSPGAISFALASTLVADPATGDAFGDFAGSGDAAGDVDGDGAVAVGVGGAEPTVAAMAGPSADATAPPFATVK